MSEILTQIAMLCVVVASPTSSPDNIVKVQRACHQKIAQCLVKKSPYTVAYPLKIVMACLAEIEP